MQKLTVLNRLVRTLIFISALLISITLPANAAEEAKASDAVSQERFDAYKELADTKLGAAKESLQKDIQNFTTRVEGQEKRIDQLNSEIDHSLAILAILLALAGVISFFSFHNVARKQALDEVKVWLVEHEKSLNDQKQKLTKEIDGFKQQIPVLQRQVADQAEKIQKMMQELEDKLIVESDELVKKMSASRQAYDLLKFDESPLSPNEASLLAKAADKTQHKPETERNFADWNRLAFAASKNNEKEQAINYWERAINTPSADDTDIAETLFKIGGAWFETGQLQKAVKTYDQLLERFSGSSILNVQETCAAALGNKGVVLGRLNNIAGAIACYRELLERYQQQPKSSTIQEYCRLSETNIAELLLVLGENAEAMLKIQQALSRIDASNQNAGIMHFLLWLADENSSISDVLTAMHSLSLEARFIWTRDDIRPIINKLPEPRKTQAECFIAFFEQHHNIETLETCLAAWI